MEEVLLNLRAVFVGVLIRGLDIMLENHWTSIYATRVY